MLKVQQTCVVISLYIRLNFSEKKAHSMESRYKVGVVASILLLLTLGITIPLLFPAYPSSVELTMLGQIGTGGETWDVEVV
ncbi:MAG: hypothetical protein ACFFFC_14200, partial [Candidatus Thorarchaeota archaeon]